jgi:PKD repeat protein
MRRLITFPLLILALGAALPVVHAQSEQFYAERISAAEFGPETVSSRQIVGPTVSIESDGNDIVAIVWSATGSSMTNEYSMTGRGNAILTGPIGGSTDQFAFTGTTSVVCSRYAGVDAAACDASPLTVTRDGGQSTVQYPREAATLNFEIEPASWPPGMTATMTVTEVYIIRYGVPPFNASFEATPTSGSAPLVVAFTDTSTSDIPYFTDWDFGDGNTSTDLNPQHTFWQNGTYTVTLTIDDGDRTDSYSIDITVGDQPNLGTLTRPLAIQDEVSVSDSQWVVNLAQARGENTEFDFAPILWRSSEGSGISVVQAVSKSPGAYVHAIAPGTVMSVEPLTWQDCNQYATVQNVEGVVSTSTTGPNSGAQEVYCKGQVALADADPQTALNLFTFHYLDVVGAQLVTVSYGDGTLTYLVQYAPRYVEVGDVIAAGCVLGQTIDLMEMPPIEHQFLNGAITVVAGAATIAATYLTAGGWLPVWTAIAGGSITLTTSNLIQPTQFSDSPYGVAAIVYEMSDEQLPLLHQIGPEYPTSEARCNQDAFFSACLTDNSELSAWAGGWYTQGGEVEWIEPSGVVLEPGEAVYQSLVLDSETSYSLSVAARGLVPINAPQIALQIGQTIETVTVTSETANYTVASGVHQPDAGTIYTVMVANTGKTDIEVTTICLKEGDVLAYSDCTFANHDFSDSLTGWSTTGSVQMAPPPYSGVYMATDATLSQNVSLEADKRYLLTIELMAAPDPLNFNLNASLTVQYNIGGGAVSMSPPIAGVFKATAVTAQIEPESNYSGPLTISVDITAGDFDAVTIYSVCLIDMDAPPGFETNCRVIPPPTGNGVGDWTFWHWGNLDNFFQCDLMPLFNRTYRRIDSGFNMLSWSVRWSQASAAKGASWLGTDLFPYLDGHFRNIALGRVTTIEGGGGMGLWDVLLAFINLIRPVIDLITSTLGTTVTLFLSVITGVIGFVVSLASQGLSIVQQATGLLGTLISAYNNAPPETLPGMPSCSADPKGHPLCIAWWVLENTIFSGPGALVIPVLTGVLSIHLVLWIVGEMKRALVETGTGS